MRRKKGTADQVASYTPCSLCGTNVILQLNLQTHRRDRATLCGCHLCMNYNQSMNEGEVGPSLWFDDARKKEGTEAKMDADHFGKVCCKHNKYIRNK